MDLSADIALYVRLISGMILGLAVARLFGGIAEIIQYPDRLRPDLLHALWVVVVLGDIVLFWWTEAQTFGGVRWTFALYLFQTAYCCSYFLLVALLMPENVGDHGTLGQYVIARRRWFFGTLVLAYFMGAANTVLKEGDLAAVTTDLWIDAMFVGLFVLGALSRSRRIHLAIAIPLASLVVLGIALEAFGVL